MLEKILNFLLGKKENNFNKNNLSLKDINKLIELQQHYISMEQGQLFIFKQREFGGDLWAGEMSERNGTKDLRLVKPHSLTKKKIKYNFGNSLSIIEKNIKQLEHNILLLKRLKRMKFKLI